MASLVKVRRGPFAPYCHSRLGTRHAAMPHARFEPNLTIGADRRAEEVQALTMPKRRTTVMKSIWLERQ